MAIKAGESWREHHDRSRTERDPVIKGRGNSQVAILIVAQVGIIIGHGDLPTADQSFLGG